jgi:hypothetical protein
VGWRLPSSKKQTTKDTKEHKGICLPFPEVRAERGIPISLSDPRVEK